MSKIIHLRCSVPLLLILLLQATWSSPALSMEKLDSSLYERLQGKKNITLIIVDFMKNLSKDPRLLGLPKVRNHLTRLRWRSSQKNMVDMICQATGGPCKYDITQLIPRHQEMELSSSEWNVMIEHLVRSLQKYRVAPKEQREMIALFGAFKDQVLKQPKEKSEPSKKR